MNGHTSGERGVDAVLERAVREELAAEPSMIAESLGVFAGRRRGWHVAAAVVTFVSFAVVVLAAVRFFGASGLEEKLMWATVFLGGLIVTLALKVYFWLQMVRNAVLREVKRVELRVVEGNRA